MNLRFKILLTLLVIMLLVLSICIVRLNLVADQKMYNEKEVTQSASVSEETGNLPDGIGEDCNPLVENAAEVAATVTEKLSEIDFLQSSLPVIDTSEEQFMLVNQWNMLDAAYVPEVQEIENVEISTLAYDSLQQFVADARAEGLKVFISSGYRSYEIQEELMEEDVSAYGQEEALKTLAMPGASEHQTGLAVDLTDVYYEYKDESIENTETYQWLLAHCQEYGFILRFPKGKEAITGIDYEPWHFRYVGVEAATYIQEHSLTLEEFLSLYTG